MASFSVHRRSSAWNRTRIDPAEFKRLILNTDFVTKSGGVCPHAGSEDIPVIHPLWDGVGDDARWSLIGGFQWRIGLV